MNAIALIQRLHQHRAWANANLLDAAQQLSEEQLHAPFPIGQGTVWKSLVHLYAAEYIWLEALQGNDDPLLPGDLPGQIPGNQLGEATILTLPDLLQKWSVLQQRWHGSLSTLAPESLEEIVYKFGGSSGQRKRFGIRRSDILLHVCTHAQYTTAQTVNMFRQLGREKFPDVMLLVLARQETAS